MCVGILLTSKIFDHYEENVILKEILLRLKVLESLGLLQFANRIQQKNKIQ